MIRAAACAFLLAAGCGLVLGIDSPTLVIHPDAAPQPDAAVPVIVTIGNVHVSDPGTERITFEICPVAYWLNGTTFVKRTEPECLVETSLDIPDGVDYYVHSGDDNRWAVTGARGIDLGEWIFGRSGDFNPSGVGTRLDLTGTGLAPTYAPGDGAEILVTNVGFRMGLGDDRILTPLPADGSSTITIGINYEMFRLIGQMFADQVLLVVTHFGPVNGQNVGQVKAYAPMTMPAVIGGGVTTAVSGAFTTTAPTKALTIDFKRSQFDALHTQVNPGAMKFTTRVAARAQPVTVAGPNNGVFFGTPWILYFDNNDVTDVDLGTINAMNPYLPSWIVVRDVEFGYFVPFMMAGVERHARGFLRSIVDIDSVGPVTTPSISPPQGPTVNGRGAFADGTDIGFAPILTWQAPATGTPNRYIVRVLRYPMGVTYNEEVDIYVPARITSITVPPGVMRQDMWHVFVIDAVTAGGNPDTEPFLMRLPYASAAVISGKFAVNAAPF